MKNYRYGGGDSYRDTDQITCAENQSINEIMDTISDQIHDSERMDVFLGDRHMAMIPTDDFFRDQAEKNSSEYSQRSWNSSSWAVDYARKQMEKYVTKQRTSRKADKQ